MSIAVGDTLPDWTGPSTEGQDISLQDLKGRKLVLYFYPKDQTPGCIKEACAFRDLQSEFAAIDTLVYGVSKDSIRSHENFIKKQELNFHLLSDTELTLQQALGVWVEKKNYGRTYMGTQRSTFLFDEAGVLRQVWPKVKIKDHADEVLAAAKEL